MSQPSSHVNHVRTIHHHISSLPTSPSSSHTHTYTFSFIIISPSPFSRYYLHPHRQSLSLPPSCWRWATSTYPPNHPQANYAAVVNHCYRVAGLRTYKFVLVDILFNLFFRTFLVFLGLIYLICLPFYLIQKCQMD